MKLYHLFITDSTNIDDTSSSSSFYVVDESINQSNQIPLLPLDLGVSAIPVTTDSIDNEDDSTGSDSPVTTGKFHYSSNNISFDLDQPPEHSDVESDDETMPDVVGESKYTNDEYQEDEHSEQETISSSNFDSGSDSDTNTNSFITAEDLTDVIPPTTKRIRHAPGFYSTVSSDNYYHEDNELKQALDLSKLETGFKFDDLSLLRPQQMLKRKDAPQFKVATAAEANSLIEQKVGTEVTPSSIPAGIKPVKVRPLYVIKYNDQNQPIKHKVRFVAQGFNQKEGIDYSETFAPTAKAKSIKMMLSDAAKNNKELKQFDVVTAFLNAKLTETVYVIFTDGCGQLSGKIWKLNKALYGLKQSPFLHV